MPLNSFCVNDSVLNRFMSFEERVLFHLYFSFLELHGFYRMVQTFFQC